ncbi:NAD-dependent epimerase/dehydratase family protein [Pontibacillus salicampi]|uniref:NAD-dependent epimerase/dehydratase family protein n=1 Tax=Pontibacillus salicampi TaxID=1449801 RepID=A0ABV6LN01_9BACI
MKVLIIGGTQFVGRHITQTALDNGHEVTLFNRGKTNQDLFTDVEKIKGDRTKDLNKLSHREWDVVIDTSGYHPEVVRQSAAALKNSVERYVFISTISVYKDFKNEYVDESYPVGTVDDPNVEDINAETYGPLKALCEQAIEEEMPGKTLSIRPGLIVGPHDPTDRFTYWVMRFARGGEVLVPGKENRSIQFIDVRDLAEWTIHMTEQQETGVYNATGFDEEITMKDVVNTFLQISPEAEDKWIGDSCLQKHDVQPFHELPLWIPESEELPYGYFLVSNHKAREKGLRFRPLRKTIEETREWFVARENTDMADGIGLDPAKEARIVKECAK